MNRSISAMTASYGRCENGPKLIEENFAGVHVNATRTQTIAPNGIRSVPSGPDVHVPDHSLYGICVAIRSQNFPEYVAKHVPRLAEKRGEHETGTAITHRYGRVFPRVSRRLSMCNPCTCLPRPNLIFLLL